MDPLDWIDSALLDWERIGLRRTRRVRAGRCGTRIEWEGRSCINFGSNDYLNLAGEALVPAVRESLDDRGWGSGASALVTGRGACHAELERELAAFEDAEAALLFSSGYAANVGTITSLVGEGDVIFSDERNHASIIDGCRLSGAQIQVYAHGNCDDLRRSLLAVGSVRRKLIVTDSLFSMGGDFAPLDKIAGLADASGAMLMVDEAHATGVFGSEGRGVSEWLGVESGVHIRVGTLSKALGSFGGFVVGSARLIEWLVNRARPYIFSTAAPEAMAAAGIEAIRRVRTEPWRRIRLLESADYLRDRLRQLGHEIGVTRSQIVPIFLRDPQLTVEWSNRLLEHGCLAPAIRPPSVPAGESLLRISLTAGHERPMLDDLCDALLAVQRLAGSVKR